jgi:predicted amidohydrolase
MKIALVQYNPAWEDKLKNQEEILLMVKNIEGVELFIFPEMSLTGFTMKSKEMSETIQGESFRFFSSIAKDKSANIFSGIIEKRNNLIYNTLIHIKPDGSLVKLYRKIHPFSYSSENEHYDAGVRPAITKIKKWKIGLTLCYDLRFPELYRKYGKKRTHLIVNIANWPDTRIEHWRTLLKSRAIENQCYVAGVNRVGKDPKLNYTGFSSVFDPTGKEIIAVENEVKVLVVDIDKNYVKEVREKFPFLNDIKLV